MDDAVVKVNLAGRLDHDASAIDVCTAPRTRPAGRRDVTGRIREQTRPAEAMNGEERTTSAQE